MSVKIDFTETEWRELNALLQFKVSLAFCADYLKVSRDTIIRRIREKFDLTFAEYHALKMENTATKLQQKAIEQALAGNATLMIFALKNLAKWSDKIEQTIDASVKVERLEEYLKRTENEETNNIDEK